jgi:N-acetyl-1-D-myo-inositol-2-amino-2-deoxy-alpha-D-glucopyranoside deacetylase
MKRLMAIFAHPDDETFSIGGTLAQIAAEDVEVTLVVATRGEEGEIAPAVDADRSSLADVREGELNCAAQALGVDRLHILGYRDSGMEGTPANEHPQAFINAPAEEVIIRLVELIREHRPEVVITFEPNGGYGHPDHIAIHRYTRQAFSAAADPDAYPQAGEAWEASRLYYTAIPRSFFDEMRQRMVEYGIDISELDWLDSDENHWTDEDIDLIMDVSGSVDDKWAALECHQTQFGSDHLFRRLPTDISKSLMAKEYFTLAWPEDEPEGGLSRLFDG